MSKIVDDFISSATNTNGVGFFEEDYHAISYAMKISLNQMRQYDRYGIVPAAFIDYLKNINAIPVDWSVPKKQRTEICLLNILWEAKRNSYQSRPESDYIRQVLFKQLHPELNNKMGSSQHVWITLEYNGKLFGLKR